MGAMILVGLKVFLTACVVVGASATAERMRPMWGGILATIPFSSGAAYVMMAMSENDAFLADAALQSLVTSIAAFAYLAVFVLLAPHNRPIVTVSCAFLSWLCLSALSHTLAWTISGAALGNIVAFGACHLLTRTHRRVRSVATRVTLSRLDLLVRGVAAGLLAAIVSVAARYVGPEIAGTLAVFPVVYLTVAFVVHRRMGGTIAAATMAAAVVPLLGVSLAFLTIASLSQNLGAALALLVALVVATSWPLFLTLLHLKEVPA